MVEDASQDMLIFCILFGISYETNLYSISKALLFVYFCYKWIVIRWVGGMNIYGTTISPYGFAFGHVNSSTR